MTNTFYKFSGIGLLSGIINACVYWILSINEGTFGLFFVFFLAGITYGLVTTPLFCFKTRTAIFLWILTTTASYAIAVQVAVRSSVNGDLGISGPGPLGFAYGGFIGSAILSLGLHFLLQKMKAWQHLSFILLGAFVPALLMSIIHVESDIFPIALLYIVWQTSITILIYYMLFLERDAK